MTSTSELEHSFRRSYTEQVAVLSRLVGMHNIDLVEDAVQNALLKALDIWTRQGRPENPSGWLFQVAKNEVIMALRSNRHRQNLLEQHGRDLLASEAEVSPVTFEPEVRDDVLRMMLAVCDPAVPAPSQVAFALKVLSGFSVREISLHLFISEESVYKRLQRARRTLKKQDREITDLHPSAVANRSNSVHSVLYALFTRGHLSTSQNENLRADLCDEAIRLATILAQHPLGAGPKCFALLALMHLVRARLPARVGPTGGLILLENQDRSLWDQAQIHTGLTWLAKSASGDEFSRFHAEAGIAAEHCLAASFSDTRWDRIVSHYEALERVSKSPVHRLNHAVAKAECSGPKEGLAILQSTSPPTWLEGSYLWIAVSADLHQRCGLLEKALALHQQALALAPNSAIREALGRRFSTQSHW